MSIMLVAQAVSVASSASSIQEEYNKLGIEPIVKEMLKEGTSVNSIVVQTLQIEGLNPQNLIKALYCLGAKSIDIREAAEKNGLSEVIVASGYKKSIAECADAMADSQAYTPISDGRYFVGGGSTRAGGGSYASPSTF